MAFEPQQSLNMLWPKKRDTLCLECALGEEEKEVEFSEVIGDDTLSGISSEIDKNICKESIRKYCVEQKCLQNILKERKISKVDFMSIDVEGYELSVLKGIDFNKVDIKCIIIENDKHNRRKLRNYIVSKGYILVARLTIDDVFVKKDLLNKIYYDVNNRMQIR